MVVALLILGALAIGELFLIWALLNRLLMQANVKTINLPFPVEPTTAGPPDVPRRKAFSIPFGEG